MRACVVLAFYVIENIEKRKTRQEIIDECFKGKKNTNW